MPPFLADVLTWPGNRQYITAIKAARDFGIPPTVLILTHKQPSDGWSNVDKKLAVAFQILDDETCPDCGIPIWIGHNDAEDIVFEIKSRVCYSCAQVENDRDKRENKKNKRKPTKGEKHFLSDETKIIHSREEFYKSESAKLSIDNLDTLG